MGGKGGLNHRLFEMPEADADLQKKLITRRQNPRRRGPRARGTKRNRFRGKLSFVESLGGRNLDEIRKLSVSSRAMGTEQKSHGVRKDSLRRRHAAGRGCSTSPTDKKKGVNSAAGRKTKICSRQEKEQKKGPLRRFRWLKGTLNCLPSVR